LLHRWKRGYAYRVEASARNGKSQAEENHVAELERKVGRQVSWKSILCGDACSMSRSRGNCKH
jgi:hypothetical protein